MRLTLEDVRLALLNCKSNNITDLSDIKKLLKNAGTILYIIGFDKAGNRVTLKWNKQDYLSYYYFFVGDNSFVIDNTHGVKFYDSDTFMRKIKLANPGIKLVGVAGSFMEVQGIKKEHDLVFHSKFIV